MFHGVWVLVHGLFTYDPNVAAKEFIVPLWRRPTTLSAKNGSFRRMATNYGPEDMEKMKNENSYKLRNH